MSKLIEELKKEHNTIAETLNEVNRLGIGTKEGQDMLMSAKSSFLAHLKKEDEHIILCSSVQQKVTLNLREL